jgi:SAM-dependent methyltransferase
LRCTIESPLVEGGRATRIKTLLADEIIAGYRTDYNVDVSKYFTSQIVSIYECETTSYQFYYPSSLEAREDLYHQLQQFEWNYKTDKWEYQRALTYIPRGCRILDVGCGPGHFLKLANTHGYRAQGLELNTSAVKRAQAAGLDVSAELISDYSEKNSASYDVVCSFQVLEHIYHVRSFIMDCMRALKPGGTLIFGVPNNVGFLRHADSAVLNKPPHHMGLWSPKSLSALPTIFNLDLTTIDIEPVAEIDWYCAVMENRWLRFQWTRTVYYRFSLSQIFRRCVQFNAKRIPGHTVLAVYKKRV